MNTPYYRHTFEFSDAAEISAVLVCNGKTVVRIVYENDRLEPDFVN